MNLLANTQTSQIFTKKIFFFTKLKRKIIELTEKKGGQAWKFFNYKFTAGVNRRISLYPANLPPEAMWHSLYPANLPPEAMCINLYRNILLTEKMKEYSQPYKFTAGGNAIQPLLQTLHSAGKITMTGKK